MEAWFRCVAGPSGAELAIFVGRDEAQSPLFIWPFEIVRRMGLRTMHWVGQDHANYSMGLYQPEFAAAVGPDDMTALLQRAASMAGGVKAACFTDQPMIWDEIENPICLLPHQDSPNPGFAVRLDRDFDAIRRARFSKRSRQTLARKERRIATYGTLEYGWAASPEDRLDVLETFFAQKSRRFRELGIPDAFADSIHRDFYRELAALDTSEPGHLRLGYLKVDDETVSTFNGIIFRNRLFVLLSSIIDGELQRWSPGQLLLCHQIEDACERGLSHYDLGVGDAPHKLDWCDERMSLIDSFIAFDVTGYVVTLTLAAKLALKRVIKTNPMLWALARSVRRTILRRSGSSAAESV
ncbi:MAG: GNAT family N-acetyltransferase [Methyloligellaceae bacterium]